MTGFFAALRIEWLKVSTYRTFWILLGIIAVCIPAFNYVIFDFTSRVMPAGPAQKILGEPFSYPNIWRTGPYNAGLMLFIPAILVITLITNEFTYRTHRQNIIDGWSRMRFAGLKLFETILLSLFVTLIVLATCLYFQTRNNGTGSGISMSWKEWRFLFFFFLEVLDYSLIAVLFAMLIRRAGLAMGLFFMYMIVEQFVVGLLRNKYNQTWVDYLPEEVTDRLIPQPFGAKVINPGAMALWETHVNSYVGIALIYILFYVLIIIWRFRNADL